MPIFVLARMSIRPLQVESVTIEKKPIVENIHFKSFRPS